MMQKYFNSKIQSARRDYQLALDAKKSINRSSYYYTFSWTEKIFSRSFFGLIRHSSYVTHSEQRFDDAKYDSDVSRAQKKVESAYLIVAKHQYEYKNKLGEAINQKLVDASLEQRAWIIMDLIDDSNAYTSKVVRDLKSLGFSGGYMAYFALQKNNQKLLSLASTQGFDNYVVDGKTILQIALNNNNEVMINSVLEAIKDFRFQFIHAVSNDDDLLVEKILKSNSKLLKQDIAGYNILHHAVCSTKSTLIVDKILRLAPELKDELTCSGDSVLKVALRSAKSDEVISSLLSYYTTEEVFKDILRNILDEDSVHCLDRLLELDDELIEKMTTEENLYEALLAKNTVVAKCLIFYGVNIENIKIKLQEENNLEVLDTLIMCQECINDIGISLDDYLQNRNDIEHQFVDNIGMHQEFKDYG